jgi:hypothetical protein
VSNDLEIRNEKIFSIGENYSNACQTEPHQLFCELSELFNSTEWKESARCLKFEEV